MKLWLKCACGILILLLVLLTVALLSGAFDPHLPSTCGPYSDAPGCPCRDSVPNAWGSLTCHGGSRMVVEQGVALCRCPRADGGTP